MKIDPDKLEEVADRLLATSENFRNGGKAAHVEFDAATIRAAGVASPCGTVACHAGWLAVVFAEKGRPDLASSMWGCGYQQGVRDMDDFLGISGARGRGTQWAFANWAHENPDLWGNTYGVEMYDSDGHYAFHKSASDEVTLETVANWYKDVSKRIRESEDGD